MSIHHFALALDVTCAGNRISRQSLDSLPFCAAFRCVPHFATECPGRRHRSSDDYPAPGTICRIDSLSSSASILKRKKA